MVSRPLLGGALTIILIAAIVVAWFGLGRKIDDQTQPATDASACLEGRADVPIIADPGVAPGLEKIAAAYNATRPVVRDHCITIAVRPGDAKATLDALDAKTWDAASNGARPAAWIPESSVWLATLQTEKPDAIAGAADSLVYSPVVYAVRNEMAEAAQGRVRWDQMAELTYASAFEAYGHTDITGSARLAMPQGPQSDATAVAAQAYATATAGGKLTEAAATGDEIQGGLHQLMLTTFTAGDGTEEGIVKAIGDYPDMDAAKVRSVPISEQRLYVATKDDTEKKVSIIRPKGATPSLDYPVIALAGDVPAEASDAVSEFFTFARKPEQMKVLTMMGFRGDGPLPEATATVDFPKIEDRMPTPDPAASVAITRVVLPSAAPTRK
ncbi:MAG: substrate-binding domain-containing protein [Gordonia sp. (in: high G+C Gram-positive bacteria)]|uniref:hypothetical protein n=1 Tax=Gordonia sp. (in: high G+C Gram-positive bacteria) TaxID=84139 RepID=UPI0039E23EF3